MNLATIDAKSYDMKNALIAEILLESASQTNNTPTNFFSSDNNSTQTDFNSMPAPCNDEHLNIYLTHTDVHGSPELDLGQS